jgi:hypothetical protein
MLLALLVLLPLLASSSLLPSTAHSLAPIYHDPALGSGHAHSSWQLSHAPQHAYELAVLSASGALLRTFSATSPLPRALLPAAELERLPPGHYSARVRARGPLATSPWGNFSAPTPLVLGLPRTALDGAAWLCTSDSIAAPAPNSNASWLRTDFVLPSARGAVTNASLFIVGLGQFQARLNGELLSQDTGAPGWTAWGKRVLYSAYAVSPSLLRLEYSPTGSFEDHRSLPVWNRGLPVPDFTKQTDGETTTIDTGALLLSHTDDGKPFSAQTLSVLRRTPALWEGNATTWTPSSMPSTRSAEVW